MKQINVSLVGFLFSSVTTSVGGRVMKYQGHTLLRWLFISSLATVIFLMVTMQVALAQQPRQLFVPTGDDGHITVSSEVISLTVSVTDAHGKFITGLKQNAFAIFEDKVAQDISFFASQDLPASIAVVFDISGSMNGEKILRAKDALARFIQTSHPEDDYCLIGFSRHAEVLMESTNDSEALLEKFSSVKPQGNTALYDAVELGLAQVVQGKWPKRALIVISDGDDNNSRTTFRKIRHLVQEADATIYTITIRDYFVRGIGGVVMDELAAMSGGRAFNPDNPEQMSEAFERIAVELRHQYSIGYVPTGFTADGKWRKLKVNVTPPLDNPRIVVRARHGYYAVADRHRREPRGGAQEAK